MHFRRLEDLRIDNDLTQQQAADILNCKREVYRRYEKEIREIPISYATALAQYYGVSLDYLCGLSDTRQAFTLLYFILLFNIISCNVVY